MERIKNQEKGGKENDGKNVFFEKKEVGLQKMERIYFGKKEVQKMMERKKYQEKGGIENREKKNKKKEVQKMMERIFFFKGGIENNGQIKKPRKRRFRKWREYIF